MPVPLEGTQFVSVRIRGSLDLPGILTAMWAVLLLHSGFLISEDRTGTGSPTHSSAFLWNSSGTYRVDSNTLPTLPLPLEFPFLQPSSRYQRVLITLMLVLAQAAMSMETALCMFQNNLHCLCDILSHFVIKFWPWKIWSLQPWYSSCQRKMLDF